MEIKRSTVKSNLCILAEMLQKEFKQQSFSLTYIVDYENTAHVRRYQVGEPYDTYRRYRGQITFMEDAAIHKL